MDFKLTSNTNKTYKIQLEQISEILVFRLESKDFPKIISLNNYNLSDMKTNYKIFSSECYNSIKLIFKEIQNFIETSSSEIIDDNNNIELRIHTFLKVYPVISFLFEKKIDIDKKLSKLNKLFASLKNEKEEEIKDIKKKSDERFDKLEKEIKNLKNEIDLKKKSDERLQIGKGDKKFVK